MRKLPTLIQKIAMVLSAATATFSKQDAIASNLTVVNELPALSTVKKLKAKFVLKLNRFDPHTAKVISHSSHSSHSSHASHSSHVSGHNGDGSGLGFLVVAGALAAGAYAIGRSKRK